MELLSPFQKGLHCIFYLHRFRKGKMYEYEPAKFDSASLISFVEYWHKNVQARPVPVERTSL